MARMFRGTALALVAAASAAVMLAAPTFAADSSTSPASPSPAPTTATTPSSAVPAVRAHWEAVAGNFARLEEARELRARLAAAGMTGFRVEVEKRDGRSWFQVEHPFLVRGRAAAQVTRLHADGFRGWLEYDRVGDF